MSSINKIQLPDGVEYEINDARLPADENPATKEWVEEQGFKTAISSADINNALTTAGSSTTKINFTSSGYEASETFSMQGYGATTVYSNKLTLQGGSSNYAYPANTLYSSESFGGKGFIAKDAPNTLGHTNYSDGVIKNAVASGSSSTTEYALTLPSANGTLATQEWVENQGYGSGGSIDTSNLVTLDGTNQNLSGSIIFNTNFGSKNPLIVSYTNSTTGVPAIAIKTDGINVYYPQAVDGVYDSAWSAFLKFPTDMEKSSDNILATREWVQAQGYGSGGSSSGPLTIQVSELPTENIDNSKVYIVAENIQVYVKMATLVYPLESLLQGSGITNPVVNYYIVPTLPTAGEITDFTTITPLHCYINLENGVAYAYGNLGTGNTWVNAGALLEHLTGTEAEDAGRTDNVFNESDDAAMRIYTYWEDVQYIYTINNQWSKANYSDPFMPDNDYTFTGRNTFDGRTTLRTTTFFGDVDHGRSGQVSFFTEQVTFNHGNVTFNNGEVGDPGKVQFNGTVDFTNATVTGLSGGGVDLSADYLWTGNHTFEGPVTLRGGSLGVGTLGTIEDDGSVLNIYHEYGILLEEGTSGAHISISHENGIEYYSDLGHSFSGPVAFDNCPTVNNQKVITADNFDYTGNVLTIKLS